MNSVQVPDDDALERMGGLAEWKRRHADHYFSEGHVSDSKFAAYFGSFDKGCKLHIPMAGSLRAEEAKRDEAVAQRKRIADLRLARPKG